MTANFFIIAGGILLVIAICRGAVLIDSFVDMRYSSNCVEDLKFNIQRMFLEQQSILAEIGVRKDFRLHNNKFFENIAALYSKMYDSYTYVSPDTNSRLNDKYIEKLRSNYEDNINSINNTIILLNSYSCRHNYNRDMLPNFLCDRESSFVENIDPRRDHGIDGTAGGLI